ncbi:MAG: M20/M25/M40 family metallo-hydrolase [Deltaproteobacteria bacterium]|nr:M20/M25/M40 family metallo-hydrolase [Deltaproteobacteria bacterium]
MLAAVLAACGHPAGGPDAGRSCPCDAPGTADAATDGRADAKEDAPPPDGRPAVYGDIYAAMDQARLVTTLRELSGDLPVTVGGETFAINERYSDTGREHFRRYWRAAFEGMGLAVRAIDYQDPNSTRPGNDLEAVLPGKSPDSIVVIVHYDSIGPFGHETENPGTDDDMTGMAIMIETARLLLPYQGRLAHTVRFVATDEEELGGLAGARAYAKQIQAEAAAGGFALVAAVDDEQTGWNCMSAGASAPTAITTRCGRSACRAWCSPSTTRSATRTSIRTAATPSTRSTSTTSRRSRGRRSRSRRSSSGSTRRSAAGGLRRGGGGLLRRGGGFLLRGGGLLRGRGGLLLRGGLLRGRGLLRRLRRRQIEVQHVAPLARVRQLRPLLAQAGEPLVLLARDRAVRDRRHHRDLLREAPDQLVELAVHDVEDLAGLEQHVLAGRHRGEERLHVRQRAIERGALRELALADLVEERERALEGAVAAREDRDVVRPDRRRHDARLVRHHEAEDQRDVPGVLAQAARAEALAAGNVVAGVEVRAIGHRAQCTCPPPPAATSAMD